ncbi:hypothetical protein pb186bvf_021168 [Paramecium bursaria]
MIETGIKKKGSKFKRKRNLKRGSQKSYLKREDNLMAENLKNQIQLNESFVYIDSQLLTYSNSDKEKVIKKLDFVMKDYFHDIMQFLNDPERQKTICKKCKPQKKFKSLDSLKLHKSQKHQKERKKE